jgi:hypothetical protein
VTHVQKLFHDFGLAHAWHIQKSQMLWKIKYKMHIADSKQSIITGFLQSGGGGDDDDDDDDNNDEEGGGGGEEETFVFFQFQQCGGTLLTRPEHLPLLLQSPCNYFISCYNKSSKNGTVIITQMQEHRVTMMMFVHKYRFKTG